MNYLPIVLDGCSWIKSWSKLSWTAYHYYRVKIGFLRAMAKVIDYMDTPSIPPQTWTMTRFPMPSLRVVSRFPTFTLGAVRSPNGSKGKRRLVPLLIATKLLHRSPISTKQLSMRQFNIVTRASLKRLLLQWLKPQTLTLYVFWGWSWTYHLSPCDSKYCIMPVVGTTHAWCLVRMFTPGYCPLNVFDKHIKNFNSIGNAFQTSQNQSLLKLVKWSTWRTNKTKKVYISYLHTE